MLLNFALKPWPAVLAWVFLLLPALAVAEMSEAEYAAATKVMIDAIGLRESVTPARELPGWQRPRKVVAWLHSPERLPALQSAAPGVEIVLVGSGEEAAAAVVDAQVLMGFCEEEIVARGPELHWIQVYWAGVEDCVAAPSVRRGNKVLTNGQRIASPALAEHSIALMMALVRALDVYHANQLKGFWQRDIGMARTDFMELAGRTVLVVGLGGIGTETAKRAHGLGMRVIATRSSSREGPDYVDYVGLVRRSHRTGPASGRGDQHCSVNGRDPRHVQRGIFSGHEAYRLFHIGGARSEHGHRRPDRRTQ